ncbi:MAG: enoyl-CoA hydratase/isomerase family protein [Alphaproteobacteria bacterium]|nr:enoyl-CoA hydratase/isomerase family protein [Alphaproteobacteria bacterium]
MSESKDIKVTTKDFVTTIEITRPPHNFFDYSLIKQIADAFDEIDANAESRAIMLCSEGKSFCAGANFGDGSGVRTDGSVDGAVNSSGAGHLYNEAVRLFRNKKPIVAAVQGAAIGGGFGLSLMPDFRVACPEARFAANFTRLGFHPGFGLTTTLPRLIGHSKAEMMFLTSRRVKGEEALEMGLVDQIVPLDTVRQAAWDLAREIATNAPLAVMSTRETLRAGLADQVKAATDRELQEQVWLRKTEDFKEGIAATSDRRIPNFKGA